MKFKELRLFVLGTLTVAMWILIIHYAITHFSSVYHN
jgi:hypothetical protein